MENNLPKGYKFLGESEHIVKNIEKGTVHLYWDGAISKYKLPVSDEYQEKECVDNLTTRKLKALRRVLRSNNPQSHLNTLYFFLTRKGMNEEYYSKLLEEDYIPNRALEKSEIDTVLVTEDGMLIAYVPAKLAKSKWVWNEKRGTKELAPVFPQTKSIDKWSGKVTTTVDYNVSQENFMFKFDDRTGGLDWFMGHSDKYDGASELLFNEDLVNCSNVQEYITVILDPANITEFSNKPFGPAKPIASKLFIKEYTNKKEDVHKIAETSIQDYVERCDEEWEELKEAVIKATEEENAKLTDFDIN
jgi:hypothetical protein